MIIFKDAITGDELFSDTFKTKKSEEDFIIECQGKMETRKGDTIDESALGANASAEEQQEQMEEAGAKTGIDVVLNHQLQDISHLLPKKTDVKNYLKKYVKNLAGKLDEKKKEKFMENCKSKFTSFLSKFTEDTSIYVGDISGNHEDNFAECNACLMFGNWNSDGMTLTFYALADGIIEEKQ